MLRKLRVSWGPGGDLAVSGSGTIVHGAGCIAYLSAWETTGAAGAQVTLYDGNAANGETLTSYTLSKGESTSEEWGLHWLHFERGLYIETNTGTVDGVAVIWADHVCTRWLLADHYAVELTAAAALAALGYGPET